MDKVLIQEFKPKGKKISNDEVNYLFAEGYKWCSKCKTVKQLNEFAKSNNKTGLDSTCKTCKAAYREKNRQVLRDKAKEYYSDNREEKLISASQYRKDNDEKVKGCKKNYYNNYKEAILEKNEVYRYENIDRIRNQQKEYRRLNRESRRSVSKIWRDNNKESLNKYRRDKYNTNDTFRLQQVCRQLVRRAYLSVGTQKEQTTREFLMYTSQDLKEHIEKQFKEGMSWDNYGEWHIDHKIPISSASSLEEGLLLSQLDNLQPLWADENLKKSNKIF